MLKKNTIQNNIEEEYRRIGYRAVLKKIQRSYKNQKNMFGVLKCQNTTIHQTQNIFLNGMEV